MMKKMMTKLLALTAAACLLLAGCSTALPSGETSPAPSQPSSPTEAAAAGSILLSVNPEILLSYDHAGHVVSLTPLNEDGQQILSSGTALEGRPCSAAVRDLVARMDAAGYFDTTIHGRDRNIVLKMEHGSVSPSEDFLEELAEEIRELISHRSMGSETVTLDTSDLVSDSGYIDRQAAQELLTAQLGREDIRFVEKDYDLDDGTYEIEFTLDGVEYEYEVDARTGKILEAETDRDDDHDDDDDDRRQPAQFIDSDTALGAALTHLGRDGSSLYDLECELDDGVYEIEFSLDGVEYEYEVDARTGRILEVETDRDDDFDDDDDWDD